METRHPRQLFVSYAAADREIVEHVVSDLSRALAGSAGSTDFVTFWIDHNALQPGDQWQQVIEDAALTSVGMLIFISRASMRSNWMLRELQLALREHDRLIIPILLDRDVHMPFELSNRVHLNMWRFQQGTPAYYEQIARLADEIFRWLQAHSTTPPLTHQEAQVLATAAVENVRSVMPQAPDPADAGPPDSVFVVHGHDEQALQDVCSALQALGVRPVVLSQLEGSAQSLLQKFFSVSKEARFAIVLLTSDDYGSSRLQYEAEGVADKALQFRARQNVILELGFFYGHLGWERVFVLQKKSIRVFPNFERPSDLDGAVFDPIDDTGKWKTVLAKKLAAAGFQLRQPD